MSGSKAVPEAWRLRGYVIERLLGSGSSGDVWQARVAATGEAVALKRLAVPSPELARRASAEAAKLLVLDHPHLVRLHGYVPDDRVAVLVLDLADAGSLAELLDTRGRITPGELITALAPIAAALAHVHGAGVIHSDVSAANVLFTRAGSPLLADLGVARLFGDHDDVESTPAYVDPLVARGGVPGPPSDVFMLGAVALHALTGTPLWRGADADTALTEAGDPLACDARLAAVASLLAAADVPPAMAAVVRRALELEPMRRGSAAELALDLRHSGEPVAVELAAGLGRRDPVAPGAGIDVPAAPTETRPRGGRHAAPSVRPARTTRSAGRSRSAQRSQAAALRVSAAAARPTLESRPSESSERARPAFERPPNLAPIAAREADPARATGVGRPPPTDAVARSRPTLPPARRRRRIVATRTAAVVGGAALALVAAALGAVLWMHAGRPTPALAAPPAAGSPKAVPSTAVPSTAVPSTAVPSTPASGAATAASPGSRGPIAVAPTPATPDATPGRTATGPAWLVTLRQLDARRAHAFATRNPRLLTRVYSGGPLLAADTALLHRIVPPGCELLGAHTSYDPIRASVHGTATVVTTSATLAPSRLVCAGQPARRARAVGPVRLRITLARSRAGMLIVGQRVLS